jgi:hypothetical protein
MHDLVNLSRITIKHDGLYHITNRIKFAPNTNGFRYAEIILNRTTVLARTEDINPSDIEGTYLEVDTGVISLSLDDYVEVRVYQSSGGALDAAGNNITDGYFSITEMLGVGPQGTQGEGDTGPQGPQGIQGPQSSGGTGPQGPQGPQAVASVGDSCGVYRSTSVNIPNNAVTYVDWDSEDHDTNDMHDLVNPSRITIKRSGQYHITNRIKFAPNTNGYRYVELILNRTAILARSKDVNPSSLEDSYLEVDSGVISLSLDDYVEVRVYQSSGGALDVAGNNITDGYFSITESLGRGPQGSDNSPLSLFIPVGLIYPSQTNGSSGVNQYETTTNKINYVCVEFTDESQTYAEFDLIMPSNYDGGTISYIVHWTAIAGTPSQTVMWELQGRALADNESIDQNFGSAIQISDAFQSSEVVHVTDESGSLTLAGSPSGSRRVQFRLSRNGGTLAQMARLLGIIIKCSKI